MGGALWRDGIALAMALLPALLAFVALRDGLGGDPGAVTTPGGLDSLAPAITLLLEGALAAVRAGLLLAGATALLRVAAESHFYARLRPTALPLVALSAVLVAARPDSWPTLALALLAWPLAVGLARLLRGNLVALLLALWWAACLPGALALLALGHWWYALNGVAALAVLAAPVGVWLVRKRS